MKVCVFLLCFIAASVQIHGGLVNSLVEGVGLFLFPSEDLNRIAEKRAHMGSQKKTHDWSDMEVDHAADSEANDGADIGTNDGVSNLANNAAKEEDHNVTNNVAKEDDHNVANNVAKKEDHKGDDNEAGEGKFSSRTFLHVAHHRYFIQYTP